MRRRDLCTLWLAPMVGLMTLGAADSSAPRHSVAQAAERRDTALLKTLLKQPVDVNLPDADGATALHWVARWNDADAARLLVGAGANLDVTNRHGATPLWIAASLGHPEIASVLLNAGADVNAPAVSGEPPLVAAEHGADVHARSTGGMTPLLFAVRQNEIELVRRLLAAGADVNDVAEARSEDPSTRSQTGNAMSALRVAIDNGDDEIAHLLIERGANVNARDRNGFTALFAAIRARGRETEAGPSEDADRTMTLLKAILAHGADVNLKLPLVRTPPNFNPDGYPQTDNIQYGGATPFWAAAVLVDLDVMRLLVAAGADPRQNGGDNTTPLMVAAGLGYGTRGPTARLGRRPVDTEAAAVAAVEQLIQWGNDVNAVNGRGQTALHGAVAAAAPAVAKVLIDHGARLDQKDEIGRTPSMVADDHRTHKYRTTSSLDPARIVAMCELLRKASGN
jgi:ankyrin repeat protein